MIKATLDSNVLISALCSPYGICANLLKSENLSKYTLITSKEILNEIFFVSLRSYFRRYFSIEYLEDFLELVTSNSTNISSDKIQRELKRNSMQLPDKDDLPIFLTYKVSNSDFLVSGNKKHFPKKNSIVTPRQFYNIINKD